MIHHVAEDGDSHCAVPQLGELLWNVAHAQGSESIIRMSSGVFITGQHRHDAPRGIVFAAQRQKMRARFALMQQIFVDHICALTNSIQVVHDAQLPRLGNGACQVGHDARTRSLTVSTSHVWGTLHSVFNTFAHMQITPLICHMFAMTHTHLIDNDVPRQTLGMHGRHAL